jgi:hypothetical protein
MTSQLDSFVGTGYIRGMGRFWSWHQCETIYVLSDSHCHCSCLWLYHGETQSVVTRSYKVLVSFLYGASTADGLIVQTKLKDGSCNVVFTVSYASSKLCKEICFRSHDPSAE